jgi:hypothetical protein
VLEALERLGAQAEGGTSPVSADSLSRIRATLFVRASRALDSLLSGQGRLLSVVTPEGKIRWREMLEVLPKTELTSVSFHPRIRISGQVPPYLPIGKIDRIRMPQPGIILATELGLNAQIFSDSQVLLDMIWDQLEGLVHPTWNELVQYLKVPRRLEIAEATASDVLRSHGESTQRLRELGELIRACRLF